ncbi:hypothetical protein FJT64_026176 [Amphibalanus amphitrite]|uniref:Uncharacterized protein n=1 Tax=Amphibalanus amphitrite TaxID=1232801 RepID=A0A6A4WHM7_AMPAM|nr:hypothetical protein FJT64_026176 [Amphibalanus amphitrite]
MASNVHYVLCVYGSVLLLLRQAIIMDFLTVQDPYLGTDTLLKLLKEFIESFIHGLLLMGLLRDRRWRFMVTLWLYVALWLELIHIVTGIVMELLSRDVLETQAVAVAMIGSLWLLVYSYVHWDQEDRDRTRRGRGSARGGRAQLNGQTEPTPELYLLVPSHTDPPLRYAPFWETDLVTWRWIARFGNAFVNLISPQDPEAVAEDRPRG